MAAALILFLVSMLLMEMLPIQALAAATSGACISRLMQPAFGIIQFHSEPERMSQSTAVHQRVRLW